MAALSDFDKLTPEEKALLFFEGLWDTNLSIKYCSQDCIDKELCKQAFILGAFPPNEDYPYGNLIAKHPKAAELIEYDIVNFKKVQQAYMKGREFAEDLEKYHDAVSELKRAKEFIYWK